MSPRKDSPEEMLSAHAWLEQVSADLGIPNEVTRSSVKEILDLTAAVAHNRSRPAAPVTAFLIGLAAGQAAAEATDRAAEQNPAGESLVDPDAAEALIAEIQPRVAQITKKALD